MNSRPLGPEPSALAKLRYAPDHGAVKLPASAPLGNPFPCAKTALYKSTVRVSFTSTNQSMRLIISNLLGCAALALITTGCAGPEQKLGRGLTNLMEPLRGGEMTRSVEQATLFEAPEAGYTTGKVRGFHRTLARTTLGLWEIATFPARRGFAARPPARAPFRRLPASSSTESRAPSARDLALPRLDNAFASARETRE